MHNCCYLFWRCSCCYFGCFLLHFFSFFIVCCFWLACDAFYLPRERSQVYYYVATKLNMRFVCFAIVVVVGLYIFRITLIYVFYDLFWFVALYHIHRHTDRQTDRQADGQTGGRTDKVLLCVSCFLFFIYHHYRYYGHYLFGLWVFTRRESSSGPLLLDSWVVGFVSYSLLFGLLFSLYFIYF